MGRSALGFLLLALAVCVAAKSRIHKSGSLEWTMIEDVHGVLQLAIISGATPAEPRAEIVLRDNVTFTLYTRENDASGGVRIYADDLDSLVGYNPANPTKIMIHGFTGSGNSDVIQKTRQGWILHGDDYNMIGVDWGVLCVGPWYNLAKDNAIPVGGYVATLIDFLVAETGAQLSDFQLIGHSLGGQVIGIAGSRVTGGRVARITGLDPALPLFDTETDDNRLDPSDADLVDVIHTDGGGLGYLTPVGHVDFYPNKGIAPQPGCEADITGQCSHTRCHAWYADSINNRDKYPAGLCDTFEDTQTATCSTDLTGIMGDALGDTPHGIYYLSTV